MVISLSAKGLTTDEVQAHLAEVYGADVSRQTISTITRKVLEGMAEWQYQPLDPVYPVVLIDAIHVKIRDGAVANRPIRAALAVTVEGRREIVGLWAGDGGEGAKHWMHILTEIKNRGVNDVLTPVCDGLKGLSDAVPARSHSVHSIAQRFAMPDPVPRRLPQCPRDHRAGQSSLSADPLIGSAPILESGTRPASSPRTKSTTCSAVC